MEFVASQARTSPQLIEISGDTAYIRKNVTSEVIDGIVFYNYLEATLTIEEFNSYANTVLLAGQEHSANNQLAIMEAFADLYEGMLMST